MVDFDPAWINVSVGAPEYNAAELRRLEAVLLFGGHADRLGSRAGLRPGLQAVTLSGTTVTINPCAGVAYPALTTTSGAYRFALLLDSLTLAVPDGTNPRKDLVCIQVQDHDEDASTFRRARALLVQGTPAVTPAEPAVPVGAFRVATITVPPSGGGSATIAYNTPWVVANGGVLPVRTTADLPAAGLYDGMTAWDIANEAMLVNSGGTWETVGSANGFQLRESLRFDVAASFVKANYPGLRAVHVRVQAGGGGGGGAVATAASQTSVGGGGQGGGHCFKWILAGALAASESVTVGAGGAGNSGATGGTGGTSSFGTGPLVSATGGAGGLAIGASGNAAGAAGGNATQSFVGDVAIRGQGGGGGFKGGASGGMGGMGGSSHYGGGGASVASSTTGTAGEPYGGGGGGALNGASQAAKAGGAGGTGIVLIELYV